MTNDLLTVEALIHRVEPIALFEMPLFRLLSPGVFSHVGPVSEKTLLSIEGLLFFSLACIMHPRSSWLAVAIFLLSSGHMILNNGMGVYLPLFIASCRSKPPIFNALLPLLSILAATAPIRLITGSIKPNTIERGLRSAGLGLAAACSLPVLAAGARSWAIRRMDRSHPTTLLNLL